MHQAEMFKTLQPVRETRTRIPTRYVCSHPRAKKSWAQSGEWGRRDQDPAEADEEG